MCDKCKPEKHSKYWIHIADDWTEEERKEMEYYLAMKHGENFHRRSKSDAS
jgi:hypothetical protein